MRWLSAAAGKEVAAALAASRALLAFDFDGTLAPIVADRTRATMKASTRALLAAACRRYPVVVVSGRARADVGARVAGLGVKVVVGNHGIEPASATRAMARAVASTRSALAQALEGTPGVELEDKRFSLSVHFRRAPRPELARRAILAAIARLSVPVRTIPGKRLVNVLPAGAPDKGDAVLRLADQARAARVLYVGDDVTDEAVFRLRDRRLVTVRVGRAAASEASWYLRRQEDLDALLAALCSAREGP
ncbi:MAG: trehalose-phosphatase [Myxococcales bacterium]|nr:trehalose-phosphatase [Myxococcales bacterium]